MIKIYGMKMESLGNVSNLKEFRFKDMEAGRTLSLAPEHWEQVMRYRAESGRRHSLMGRLLAARALYGVTGVTALPPYRLSCKGKPELPGFPGVHFNVSHSGSYALCAIADHPVGIDIQERKAISPAVAKRFFTAEEKEALRQAGGEWEMCFYRIWTAKEAYVKYSGAGLPKGMETFTAGLEEGMIKELGEGGGEIAFSELTVPDGAHYCAAVCGGGCADSRTPVICMQELEECSMPDSSSCYNREW